MTINFFKKFKTNLILSTMCICFNNVCLTQKEMDKLGFWVSSIKIKLPFETQENFRRILNKKLQEHLNPNNRNPFSYHEALEILFNIGSQYANTTPSQLKTMAQDNYLFLKTIMYRSHKN